MAESLISTVLNQLATITRQEVNLLRGVDADIEKLTSNLLAIQAVLDDAEKQQMKEATVELWLEKLKDVSYDIDDVLDEWNTAILKQDAEKVWSSCPLSSGFCFRQVCLRRDIALKIKKLNVRLDAIANEKNAYNFKSGRGSQEPRLLTTSVIDVSEVFEREQDTDNIKSMLFGGNSERAATLLIISIVGMGGLGKTTLARLAFNDPLVVNHFDKRIWVCVSNPFDDKRIAKEILESLKGEKTDLDGMDTILEKIRENISGKTFLLVLDDVWAEDSTRWEPLKGSLKCGSPKSRILLTTRKEKVATVMGSGTTDMVSLGLLSEEGCWKLFTHLAFSGRPDGECQNLEDVGRRMVEKCKGLPLAVKTIGSLLRFKKSKKQWQIVLDSEMWEIKEVEEDVFHPLLVSYYDLSSVLRQCFTFCAVFSEDYVIDKDELIKLWMAQGFLHESQHKEMEIVGEEYFNELAMRSFFQDFKENENGDIVGCKLHDLVHYFAQFLTKKECFLVRVDDLQTREVSLPFKTIRHSFLLMGENAKFPILMNNWEKARTLLVESNWGNSRENNLLNSIDKLVSLRILRFDKGSISKKVRKLIHLRYLNLSNNRSLKTLPEALCDLYNLQILDISCCTYLRRLPHRIGKLKNLRYLENNDTPYLFLPIELKRLSGLRIIREVNLSSQKSAFKIGDLANFSNLQGCLTQIRGLERAEASEVRAAQLSTKISHRKLTLRFSGDGKIENQNEAVVLEALKPPPLLESLDIWYSMGPTLFPSWITSLTMLKTLLLGGCYNWERLPPLGKLLSLQSLTIHWLKKVRKVGEEFLGIEREEEEEEEEASSSIIAFPKLEQLTFNQMPELEDWEYGNLFSSTSRDGGITIMPLLRSLEICYCPKLKALPHHLFPQLQGLRIVECPILARRYEVQRGEDWPYISHIPQRHIWP